MEVRNRFRGLDLIDRVPDDLWTEVHDIVQETGIKTIPMEKKCKKKKRIDLLVSKSLKHKRSNCCVLHAKFLQSCLTLATLWTVTCQAPLSKGFSRQEYWSGFPCPAPGDLPDLKDTGKTNVPKTGESDS